MCILIDKWLVGPFLDSNDLFSKLGHFHLKLMAGKILQLRLTPWHDRHLFLEIENITTATCQSQICVWGARVSHTHLFGIDCFTLSQHVPTSHYMSQCTITLPNHTTRSLSNLCKLTDSLFQQVIEKPLLIKELMRGQVLDRGPIEVLVCGSTYSKGGFLAAFNLWE